jgi:hypothetical protein
LGVVLACWSATATSADADPEIIVLSGFAETKAEL